MGFFDGILHGMKHGFMHQMFGFGGFGCYGGLGFGGFGCGINSCWDSHWNSCWFQPRTPLFFNPSYYMGGNYMYPELMTTFPTLAPTEPFRPISVWDNPTIQTNCNYGGLNWQNITIQPAQTPQFEYKFIPTTLPKTKPESEPKLESSNNTDLSTIKDKPWHKLTEDEIKLIYGDYQRDITTPYTGTVEDLNEYLKDKGVLKGHGQAFLDAQNEYGISASVLVGIVMNESDRGKDEKGSTIHNVGGVREFEGKNWHWKEYDSVADCIKDIARFLKSGYVNNKTKTLTKLNEINSRYCPVSDPTDNTNINRYWARNVEIYTKEAENAKAVNA